MMLETERLILRPFRETDLKDLYEYLSDGETVRYEPYRPMTLAETRDNLRWRMDTGAMIAVERREDHKLIGNLYFAKGDFETAELGYVFNRRFWGHGYASESCRALIADAFAGGVHRIIAECDPENANSWRLLEALCFTREAHLRKNVYFWKDEQGSPIWKDTYVYARLSTD